VYRVRAHWPPSRLVVAILLSSAPAAALGQTPRSPGTNRLQTMPLTALDERALAPDLDTHLLSIANTQPVPVGDLLLLLVHDTGLSLVADPAIGGTFIGELKNVTVRQALNAVLPPLGLEYHVDGSVITVVRRAPETRLFDVNYIAAQRAASSRVGEAAGEGPLASVTTTSAGDVFADLAAGVRTILSEHATFNIDRKAGLLQVTDVPERLDRVGYYLDAVLDHVHRQVQIEARIVEVELADAQQPAIDWQALTTAVAQAAAGPSGVRAATKGLRVTDVPRFLSALGAQGTVSIVRDDRLTALNNEPSIVKTDRLTLSVTPQIGTEGIVMLSLTPIIADAPTAAADTLARVADGETVVVSGLARDRETKERKNVGRSGGWFGRATVVTKKHVEVLILLTPTTLQTVSTQ
jgi:type II secretory pathway component GspD/PulD (secretin)